MFKLACVLALCLAAVSASTEQQRIVGGSITNIGQYPFAAVVLVPQGQNFRQNCGGTIINNRSLMSAAHCWDVHRAANLRIRVGSTNANSGGNVHNVAQLITHPNYNVRNLDNDVGVIRVATAIAFGNNVRVGGLAGANFNVPDNQAVWVIGWGLMASGGSFSEQLRHIQLLTINQAVCQRTWNFLTANMLCAGWTSAGRGPCSADSGGPLVLNNVIVGVTSFTPATCGDGRPAGFVRVSRVSNWVRSNA